MTSLLWLHAGDAPAATFPVVTPPPTERWWSLDSEPELLALADPGRQAAVRLALRHPDRFPVAAALDAAFDFHDLYDRGTALDDLFPTRERARQATAVLHVDPHKWPPHLWFAADPAGPWHRGADRLHEKLTAYGVPHTTDLDTTGPGYVEKMLPQLLAFVAAGLAREARRLA
jgi:hypothetical protein